MLPTRIRPVYRTIDRSDAATHRSPKGRHQTPQHPLHLVDLWEYIPKTGRVEHLRVHSTSLDPDTSLYTTHHQILIYDGEDENPVARLIAVCNEYGTSRDYPPNYDEVLEVTALRRKIENRCPGVSEWSRRILMTDQTLPVATIGRETQALNLPVPGAVEIPVRETIKERSTRTWRERQAREGAQSAA